MLSLQNANDHQIQWAQQQVTAHHYLHTPVDTRSSVFVYVVMRGETRVGCLFFGRPESTCCYQGCLTYGSVDALHTGRVQYSRWEILNLARVWLDPRIQAGGEWYVPHAGTQVIGLALKMIVVDYLERFLPVTLDEPWRIRQVLSYCDTRLHRGTLYRAAGFALMRTNENGIQTWARPVRSLQGSERKYIEKLVGQSSRSRRYRSRLAVEQYRFV